MSADIKYSKSGLQNQDYSSSVSIGDKQSAGTDFNTEKTDVEDQLDTDTVSAGEVTDTDGYRGDTLNSELQDLAEEYVSEDDIVNAEVITATMEQIFLLEQYRARIKARGVGLADIATLEQHHPNLISKGAPESYTYKPSQVNKEYALEAIGKKIADGARKVWEWIIEKLKQLKERILSGKDLIAAKVAALKKRVKIMAGSGKKIPVTVTAMRLKSGGDMTDFSRLIFTMAEISKKLSDTATHPESKTNIGEAYITYIDKSEGTSVAHYDMDLTERQIADLVTHMEKMASIYYDPKVTRALEVMMGKVNGILSGQVEADVMQKTLAESMKGYIQILIDVRSILISLDVKSR